MNIWKSLLLGIIQGVTEFLPVSSSGHLVLFRKVLSVEQVPLLFDVLLHVATLIVIIYFFRSRVLSILAAMAAGVKGRADEYHKKELKLVLVILVGTVFTALIGFTLQDIGVLHETSTVSVLFIFTGVLLLSLKFLRRGEVQLPRMKHGIWVGIAQGLGTLPGISRSGITIAAGLYGGLDRKVAGELSFLMSIPAVAGALILELSDAAALSTQLSFTVLAAGFAAAFITGLASLKLLFFLISSGRLYLFSLYLIPLGCAGLLFL
jgi:undecaprenyl-diphosphatase